MTTQPLLPSPAGLPPTDGPPNPERVGRVSPRTLMALGAYGTPVIATAMWFAAFAVARAAPGGASDDFTWLPLFFWIAAAPVWVLAALIGTLGVVLPPPHNAGRVGLVLLVPLLVAAYIETWVWMPHWQIADDGFRVSTASTVVTVTGALLTLVPPVLMVVGLALAHVVGRWWWVAAVVVTALLAVGQWGVDAIRYTGDMPENPAAAPFSPGDTEPDPAYADPTDVPCTGAQLSAVEKVMAAIPWPTQEQPGLGPDAAIQLDGMCIGSMVLVEASYADVTKQLPAELARLGVAVEPVYADEYSTELVGTTIDGTPVDVSVSKADERSDLTLVAVTTGEMTEPDGVPAG